MIPEPLSKTALEQARLIASGELSCEELVRLYLDRIESVNPKIHAFIEVDRRSALRSAQVKQALVRAGERLPVFHGVPIGIKDMNLARGFRSRFGSRAFPVFRSPIDDTSVAPLRRAGFIILGKLSTSELGVIPITEPDIHPPTCNPFNTDYTAGGSSGGSGAAVAAGLIPVAHASDGGGSIRIPASFTNLIGLKPARGRLRNQFALPDRRILYTTGAVTHDVADSAALLDLMAGISDGRPHWATPPAEPFASLARKEPKRCKIRFSIDSPLTETHPEVRAIILQFAKRLSALGHTLIEGPAPSLGLEDFIPIWARLMASFPMLYPNRAQPITRWLRAEGKKLDSRLIQEQQNEFERQLHAWFDDSDLWLTPTVPILPPKVGEFRQTAEDPKKLFARIAPIAAFTAISNITGQPAISIPAGISTGGLPIGAQLIGPPQGEALLLQVARQMELAHPWASFDAQMRL